jgi:hypothetical protein
MLSAFWSVGMFGIGNGYATPVQAHIDSVGPEAYKHYVGARVWRSSREFYELTISRDVFDCLQRPPSRNGTYRASSSIP